LVDLRPLSKRTSGFLRLLFKSKMSAVGLIVLVLFSFFALAAPLITPYDPQHEVVAGVYSPPAWYRSFNEGRLLSQNQVLDSHPGFKTDPTQQGWEFARTDSQMSGAFDDKTSSEPGSGSYRLTLDRSAGPLNGSFTATFKRTFDWTYKGPPARFVGSLQVKTPDATPPELVIVGSTPALGQSLEIDARIKYIDTNGNAAWDDGEPVVYDTNSDGAYNTGDIMIVGVAPTQPTQLAFDPKLKFVDSTGGGTWNAGEAVLYDRDNNGLYGLGEPVSVVVFIERLGNDYQKWDITDRASVNTTASPQIYNKNWANYPLTDSKTWQSPITLDSLDSSVRANLDLVDLDPSALIFSSPGQYTFGVNVTVNSNSMALTPMNVYMDDMNLKLYGTSWGLLGTDVYGYDIWSQLIYGARVSLAVGLLAAFIGIALGLLVGLMAGYMGNVVDEVLMRFTDMLLVIPGLPLLIVLVAVIGNSLGPGRLFALIVIIGFLGWMGFARVVRAQVLSLKERPFVEAAKAAGAGAGHITTRHIIPNIVGLIYVNLALAVPGAILSEAALSFLGLGDVTIISWGRMLNLVEINGAQNIWWWVVPPGISIALVSLAFVMIGFSLDTLFNPRLRERR